MEDIASGDALETADGRRGTVEDAVALAAELVDAWGSWGPNMTPDARQVAFISDRSGTPQLWVQDVVLDGPPPPGPAHRALRRPGRRGPLGGRQRLAHLRGGHRRRRPHPGVGGAPRRLRRPPHRRRRPHARRARPVDPQRAPLRGHLPRAQRRAPDPVLPGRPADRPARPARRGAPDPRPRHLARGAVPRAQGRRARAAVRVGHRPADGRGLQRAPARRHRLDRGGRSSGRRPRTTPARCTSTSPPTSACPAGS